MSYLRPMNEADALERTFEQVRKLPPEARERVRLVLDEMLAEAEADCGRDLDDPEYRAYVEQALEEAEEDYKAGRYSPLNEAIDRVLKDFARRHDV